MSAIARSLFSEYVYAFELTSLLLIVAVIGTVILARRSYGADGRRAGQHGGESAPAENAPASQEARQ